VLILGGGWAGRVSRSRPRSSFRPGFIAAIARTCGDRLIETRGFTGADGLHAPERVSLPLDR